MFKDNATNEAPESLSAVQLFFVEMPKFEKDWPEVKTALDRWVSFLNKAGNLSRSSLPEQLAADPAVVKAMSELERIRLDPAERVIYEGEVKKQMIDATQIKSAEERGRHEGRQEGVQQGMQMGVRQGRQEGVQQGMQQVLIRQMGRRFGPVPETIVRRLQSLSVEALDDLGVELLVLSSYDDVQRWMDGR